MVFLWIEIKLTHRALKLFPQKSTTCSSIINIRFLTEAMLRSGVYSLWKSYNCTALEAYNAAQCVSGCMALLKKDWASPCSVSPYSTDSLEEERVINNPKVLELADQITQLNLLEVSDLTELLRKRLNIQSLPSVGGFPMGGMHVNAGATQGKEFRTGNKWIAFHYINFILVNAMFL